MQSKYLFQRCWSSEMCAENSGCKPFLKTWPSVGVTSWILPNWNSFDDQTLLVLMPAWVSRGAQCTQDCSITEGWTGPSKSTTGCHKTCSLCPALHWEGKINPPKPKITACHFYLTRAISGTQRCPHVLYQDNVLFNDQKHKMSTLICISMNFFWLLWVYMLLYFT